MKKVIEFIKTILIGAIGVAGLILICYIFSQYTATAIAVVSLIFLCYMFGTLIRDINGY